ncbi:MAG TPA: hypothetical protein VII99_14105, partial [Bacteroidia bacterium]
MKNILYYTLIGMVLFSCSSCRSKKSTTTTSVSSYTAAPPQTTSSSTPPSSTPTQPSTTIIVTQPQNAPQIQNDNVRLVVSFFSIGQGIDLKTHDEFLKFLDSYPKKIAYSPKHWGREGEVDYCLSLNELSPVEQNYFVKKANDILLKSSFVHMKENGK